MKLHEVILIPLQPEDREQFILDNQWAFKYGAQQEFGMRDERCEEGDEVISRKTIEPTKSLHPSTRKPGQKGRAISQCGVVNKFLTNFEDLIAVYLFGIQIHATASQHEIL